MYADMLPLGSSHTDILCLFAISLNMYYVAVQDFCVEAVLREGFRPRSCHYVRASCSPASASSRKSKEAHVDLAKVRVFAIRRADCKIRELKYGGLHLMTPHVPADCLELLPQALEEREYASAAVRSTPRLRTVMLP